MEKYAFIVDAPIAEYIANRKPCDLYTIEPFLPIREYAFAVKKGDELKGQIDGEMRVLLESQQLQNMYIKWWTGECHKRKPTPTMAADADASSSTQNSPWRYATASMLNSDEGRNRARRDGTVVSVLVAHCALVAWIVS